MRKIPAKLLRSSYRKRMWEESSKILAKLEKVIPIEEAYVLGSFTTKKSRPADVDFIILLKVQETDPDAIWSVDLVIAPNNSYGKFVQDDAEKWVRQKYRLKGYTMVRLK